MTPTRLDPGRRSSRSALFDSRPWLRIPPINESNLLIRRAAAPTFESRSDQGFMHVWGIAGDRQGDNSSRLVTKGAWLLYMERQDGTRSALGESSRDLGSDRTGIRSLSGSTHEPEGHHERMKISPRASGYYLNRYSYSWPQLSGLTPIFM
jgi:hypothetical protein